MVVDERSATRSAVLITLKSRSRQQTHSDKLDVCNCLIKNSYSLRYRFVVPDVTDRGIPPPTEVCSLSKQSNNLRSAWQDTYQCILLGSVYRFSSWSPYLLLNKSAIVRPSSDGFKPDVRRAVSTPCPFCLSRPPHLRSSGSVYAERINNHAASKHRHEL